MISKGLESTLMISQSLLVEGGTFASFPPDNGPQSRSTVLLGSAGMCLLEPYDAGDRIT